MDIHARSLEGDRVTAPNGDPLLPFWRAVQRILVPAGPTAVVLGTVANIIQVATASKPSTLGLWMVGAGIFATSVHIAYQVGKSGKNGDFEMLSKELRDIRSGLEGTFGAYRPYQDDRTVFFNVGERPEDDAVEESHQTTNDRGSPVYWCLFEAFNLDSDQKFRWSDIDLRVNRSPAIDNTPEQAVVIKVTNGPTLQALIAFEPPSDYVIWMAKYATPGLWSQLRQAGQLFEWTPPSVGPDDTSGRRSPITTVKFVFRVPAALGSLEIYGTPSGVVTDHGTDGPAANRPFRVYTVRIPDVAALLDGSGASDRAVQWHMRLRRGGG